MEKQHDLVVHIDGGSRGNPGPAASGVVISTTSGEVLEAFGEFLGTATNNFAEYMSLKLALEHLGKHNPGRVDVYMDSQLLERTLNGVYRQKNLSLRPIYEEILRLAKDFDIHYHHVPRQQNKAADRQVNLALDEALGLKKEP